VDVGIPCHNTCTEAAVPRVKVKKERKKKEEEKGSGGKVVPVCAIKAHQESSYSCTYS
jgi:hypothetical protein